MRPVVIINVNNKVSLTTGHNGISCTWFLIGLHSLLNNKSLGSLSIKHKLVLCLASKLIKSVLVGSIFYGKRCLLRNGSFYNRGFRRMSKVGSPSLSSQQPFLIVVSVVSGCLRSVCTLTTDGKFICG